MGNIRNLKKYLKSLTEDLKDECLIYLVIYPEVTPKSMADIIKEIDHIAAELLSNVNHYKYKPAELNARQFINVSIAEAEKKLNLLLEKLRNNMK